MPSFILTQSTPAVGAAIRLQLSGGGGRVEKIETDLALTRDGSGVAKLAQNRKFD